jgi:hypothetical protein
MVRPPFPAVFPKYTSLRPRAQEQKNAVVFLDKENEKSFIGSCPSFSGSLLQISQKSAMLKQGKTPPGSAGRRSLRKKGVSAP